MKGLKHNVIEINDTQNDNIDRILVFLKPDAGDVAVKTTRAQAVEMLQELDVKKVRRMSPSKIFWLCAAVAVALLAVCCIFLI